MYHMDPITARLEYEEHRRWLHRLYGNPVKPNKPSRVSRLVQRLLYVLGGTLVSVGERMQPRRDTPTTSPVMK
jgi:hypothetical protein